MDRNNFRDVKPATVITVLEGNGKDIAFREVYYVYDHNTEQLLGKIDPLTSIIDKK